MVILIYQIKFDGVDLSKDMILFVFAWTPKSIIPKGVGVVHWSCMKLLYGINNQCKCMQYKVELLISFSAKFDCLFSHIIFKNSFCT